MSLAAYPLILSSVNFTDFRQIGCYTLTIFGRFFIVMAASKALEAWFALKEWFYANFAEIYNSFAPGVESSALTEFGQEIYKETNQNIPSSFFDVYSQNDGQHQDAQYGAIFGLTLLSLESVYTEWCNWREMAIDDSELATLKCKSYPIGKVNPVYIDSARIPFAYDWGGNFLGIDLNPGPEGQIGQVINFGSDEATMYVLANSFEDFLQWLLTQYQSRNYETVSQKFGGQIEREFRIKSPSASSFLDAVPLLFGPDN